MLCAEHFVLQTQSLRFSMETSVVRKQQIRTDAVCFLQYTYVGHHMQE